MSMKSKLHSLMLCYTHKKKKKLSKCIISSTHLLCTPPPSSSLQQRIAEVCCVGSGAYLDENGNNWLGVVQVCSGQNSAVKSWRAMLWCGW